MATSCIESDFSGDSDSGDETDSIECAEPLPKLQKTSKYAGAFKYKSKFSVQWKTKWAFLAAVPGNPHSFRCNVCNKSLSCQHQGIADVKAHIATKSHQKNAKAVASQPRLNFRSADDTLSIKEHHIKY